MTSRPEGVWLSREHPIPLACQLAAGLEAAIRDGHLRSGTRLPSTRDLARRLGVHRSTVGAAYGRLRRRGCIEVSPGRRPSLPARPTQAPRSGEESPDSVARRIVEAALRDAASAGVPVRAVLRILSEVAARLERPWDGAGPRLFEPRPGLRSSLVAELAGRLGVQVRSLARPPRGPGGGPVLARREVIAWLEARTSAPDGRPEPRPDWIPLSLAGGTRERGIVRRAVRTGLVVLFSPSETVRRYAAELAVREYARGVSFTAIDPRDRAPAVRAAAAARLILFDAASQAAVPPGRARAERIRLLAERDIEALRGYLDLALSTRCGT